MLTGIFNDPVLDRRYQLIFQQLLNRYLDRAQEHQLFGCRGLHEFSSQHSGKVSQADLDDLSVLSLKDGKVWKQRPGKEKGADFISTNASSAGQQP